MMTKTFEADMIHCVELLQQTILSLAGPTFAIPQQNREKQSITHTQATAKYSFGLDVSV